MTAKIQIRSARLPSRSSLVALGVSASLFAAGCNSIETARESLFGGSESTPRADSKQPRSVELVTARGERVRVYDPPVEIGTASDGSRIDAPDVTVEYETIGDGAQQRKTTQYRRLIEQINLQQTIFEPRSGGRVSVTPRVDGTVRVEMQPATLELRGGGLVSYGIIALLDDRGQVLAWTKSGNEALSRSSAYIVTRATSFVLPEAEWRRAKYVASSGPRLERVNRTGGSHLTIERTTEARMVDLRSNVPNVLPSLANELEANTDWWSVGEIFVYTDEEAAEVLERAEREAGRMSESLRERRSGRSGGSSQGRQRDR